MLKNDVHARIEMRFRYRGNDMQRNALENYWWHGLRYFV